MALRRLLTVDFKFLHAGFCIAEPVFLFLILAGISAYVALTVAASSGAVHAILSSKKLRGNSRQTYCTYLLGQSCVDLALLVGAFLLYAYSLNPRAFSYPSAVLEIILVPLSIFAGLMAIRTVRVVWCWFAFWRVPPDSSGTSDRSTAP